MQVTVYNNSPVAIHFYSGCLKIQSLNHWLASRSYQDGITFYVRRCTAGGIRISQDYAVRCIADVEADFYSFLFECLFYSVCYIAVFAGNKFVTSFEYGHFASEACIHGSKLQSDITSAHDNQMSGQYLQFHQ